MHKQHSFSLQDMVPVKGELIMEVLLDLYAHKKLSSLVDALHALFLTTSNPAHIHLKHLKHQSQSTPNQSHPKELQQVQLLALLQAHQDLSQDLLGPHHQDVLGDHS